MGTTIQTDSADGVAAITLGDDHALGDTAHEVMFKALDMADDADTAARAMLLATANLIHDDLPFGQSIRISTILMDTLRTTLDRLHAEGLSTGSAASTGQRAASLQP